MEKKLSLLLSYLRALYQFYQHMHWESSGENYYGDHLLFERLYEDIEDEMDGVAEKAIGLAGGSDAINMKEDSKMTNELVEKFKEGGIEEAIFAEKAMIEFISEVMAGETTDGLEDLLQGIASKHEEHLYLLQQRAKKANHIIRLFKLATRLDKMGHYDEADAIDKAIKDLAARVGISVDDLVVLADDLDDSGYLEAASSIDGIIKKQSVSREDLMRQLEQLRRENERMLEEKGRYVEHENPEEQSKAEKEQQRRFRRQMELEEDRAYEAKQKEKLKKQLQKESPKSRQKNVMTYNDRERERKMVEEFMSKNPDKINVSKEPKSTKEDSELSFEELLKKYPTESIGNTKTPMCVTQGHGSREAVVRFSHGGILGEDMPPLSFCEECASLLKLDPIGDKVFNIKNPNLKRVLVNRFYSPGGKEKK